MFKQIVAFAGAGFLALGCGGGAETKTFLTNQTDVPDDDAETTQSGQDFNADGSIDGTDNALPDLNASLAIAGIDIEALLNGAIAAGTILIAADVTSKDFTDSNKVDVSAYLAATADGAAPKLDGTDVITLAGNQQEFAFNGAVIAGGNLTTDASQFVFALPLDPANPTLLTLKNAKLAGNVSGATITGGALSGTVDFTDFAVTLGGIGDLVDGLVQQAAADANGGTAQACAANGDCAAIGGTICTDVNGDATATGFCIPSDNGVVQILGLTDGGADGNGDGHIDIVFDAAAGVFSTNEATLLVDIAAAGASPSGIIGGLFRLDLNADGNNDAMGLGLLFNAVAATRQ